jgi:hypothetical protein
MQEKKTIFAIFKILPLALLAIFTLNNCGPFQSMELESNTDRKSQVLDNSKPFDALALLSAEQMLSSMLNVTNVISPSQNIKKEYQLRYGALAAGTDLNLANAPVQLSTTSLAGEVCNAMLITEKSLEAAKRNFFSEIDFSKGCDNVSEAAFKMSLRGMARSFWGRNETDSELNLFLAFKTDFSSDLDAAGRNQAAASNNLLVGTCAAMLSSVDAITY